MQDNSVNIDVQKIEIHVHLGGNGEKTSVKKIEKAINNILDDATPEILSLVIDAIGSVLHPQTEKQDPEEQEDKQEQVKNTTEEA